MLRWMLLSGIRFTTEYSEGFTEVFTEKWGFRHSLNPHFYSVEPP